MTTKTKTICTTIALIENLERLKSASTSIFFMCRLSLKETLTLHHLGTAARSGECGKTRKLVSVGGYPLTSAMSAVAVLKTDTA
jgi:hypothetical protein